MAWHLEDINDESGYMSRNPHEDGHTGRHHHGSRQIMQAEIMVRKYFFLIYPFIRVCISWGEAK